MTRGYKEIVMSYIVAMGERDHVEVQNCLGHNGPSFWWPYANIANWLLPQWPRL